MRGAVSSNVWPQWSITRSQAWLHDYTEERHSPFQLQSLPLLDLVHMPFIILLEWYHFKK